MLLLWPLEMPDPFHSWIHVQCVGLLLLSMIAPIGLVNGFLQFILANLGDEWLARLAKTLFNQEPFLK